MNTVTHVSGQKCHPCIRWTEAGDGGRLGEISAAQYTPRGPPPGLRPYSPQRGRHAPFSWPRQDA